MSRSALDTASAWVDHSVVTQWLVEHVLLVSCKMSLKLFLSGAISSFYVGDSKGNDISSGFNAGHLSMPHNVLCLFFKRN